MTDETVRVLLREKESLLRRLSGILTTIEKIDQEVARVTGQPIEDVRGRFTARGRYVRTLDETKAMDFPYPPEQEEQSHGYEL